MEYSTTIDKYGNFIHVMGVSFSLKAINEKEFRIETREIREEDDSVKYGFLVIYLSKEIFFVTPNNEINNMLKLSKELTKIISIGLHNNSSSNSPYVEIDSEKISLFEDIIHIMGISFSLKSINEKEFRIEAREIHDDDGKVTEGFLVIYLANDQTIVSPNGKIEEIMTLSNQMTSFICEQLNKQQEIITPVEQEIITPVEQEIITPVEQVVEISDE
jgi:hypothetical protein